MIPDYQTLMRPVLACAAASETRIGDAVERLAEQLSLTPDERAQLLPSGKQTMFANRVHWAKTYLVKAGLAEGTRRGYYHITPRGQAALAYRLCEGPAGSAQFRLRRQRHRDSSGG